MKRILAYLLLLSLLIIFVSACGSDTPPPTSSSVNTYRSDFISRADAGSGNVTLDWQMDPSASTYNIYWIADTTGAYNATNLPPYATMQGGNKITKVGGNNIISAPVTVTSLNNGTTYWFSITGVNSTDIESNLSIPISSIPVDPPPPPAPEDVRANAGNNNVIVTWDEVSGATSYNLYYEKFSSDLATWTVPAEIIGVTSPYSGPYAANIPIVNPPANVTVIYMFWVTAVNSNNANNQESSASFAVQATPSATPPPMAPVLTSVTTGISPTYQIYLIWNAPTTFTGTIDHYTIYYGTAKGVTKSNYGGIETTDGTSGAMTGLTSGTTYYFVITATDHNGESAESNEKSAVAY